MSIESKLLERNTPLPTYKLSSLPLEPAVITGNLVFVSGNTPIEGDVLLCKGTVGVEVSVEQARKCAEACAYCPTGGSNTRFGSHCLQIARHVM